MPVAQTLAGSTPAFHGPFVRANIIFFAAALMLAA
jgi:hypothetical protein